MVSRALRTRESQSNANKEEQFQPWEKIRVAQRGVRGEKSYGKDDSYIPTNYNITRKRKNETEMDDSGWGIQ